jgi:hypothetical protein
MASWTNDSHIQSLMRAYVAAAVRLDDARATGATGDEIDRLEADKRAAARAYEEALVARGWRIPGLAIGPLARAARW